MAFPNILGQIRLSDGRSSAGSNTATQAEEQDFLQVNSSISMRDFGLRAIFEGPRDTPKRQDRDIRIEVPS